MTDHIDRGLKQSINEVADIHNTFLDGFDEDDRHRATTAAILTLATVTHHQNGMKP